MPWVVRAGTDLLSRSDPWRAMMAASRAAKARARGPGVEGQGSRAGGNMWPASVRSGRPASAQSPLLGCVQL